MRKILFACLAVICVVALTGAVWAWENVGPGRTCEMEHSTTFDFGAGGGNGYPTIESALARFGRFPGIRGQLPQESLIPTDEDAPEFGATVDFDSHADTKRGRVYDIWKDGAVVQSVTIDSHRDGWRIGGYSGCSPIP
jgi:hypothetical protein